MDLHTKFPGLSDLKIHAKRRIPHFVYEYLDSATGHEVTKRRNNDMLDQVKMMPSILHGVAAPDLSVNLFDTKYALPFGIAPVGMSGLMWPNAEYLLARAATHAKIPYCLSTVASQTPEHVAPVLGDNGWFQLYAPKDPGIMRDMLARVKSAGFKVLILTVDVPVASRRERQTRSGLTQPPKFTPRLLWQVAKRPAWATAMLRNGTPEMRFLSSYIDDKSARSSTDHIGYLLRTSPDRAYLAALRAAWDGPIIIKGVMDPLQIKGIEDEGVDALWVSNHAGRQFDGAPASIEMLPKIRAQTQLPIIFDSGVRGGLDIVRALALGADFVMLGSAWHYALGALSDKGPAHLIEMLERDIISNMGQLGANSFADLPGRLVRP